MDETGDGTGFLIITENKNGKSDASEQLIKNIIHPYISIAFCTPMIEIMQKI